MALFDKLKGIFVKKEVNAGDYLKIAEDLESKGLFLAAVNEYERIIAQIYAGKDPFQYLHITKKLINLNVQLGNFDKVIQLWPNQYSPQEYSSKYKLELALILEKAGKIQEAEEIYISEGNKLQLYKIEFLIRQKRIDDANRECTRLLLSVNSNGKGVEKLWLLKGKILMSIRRWEEAESYFIKILERNAGDLEAKKLKMFCSKQLRR